ncbi:MAG: 6,7-dimethyl-8-ribityllumazine synthase [Planctomycetota bacterium JB042]
MTAEGRPGEREGEASGEGLGVAIVVSRYHHDVTSRLLAGARAELSRRGVRDEDVRVVTAPGAFELPLLALAAADRDDVDAVVCLGCVVRGETDHYDWVCGGVSSGLQQASLETGVPIGFGVLTVDTLEQAYARAGGDVGDKGRETVDAVLESVAALKSLVGD